MALAAFADQLHAFFRAAEGTSRWRAQMAARNAATVGLPSGGRVPLRVYFSRTGAAWDLSPAWAFGALREAASNWEAP